MGEGKQLSLRNLIPFRQMLEHRIGLSGSQLMAGRVSTTVQRRIVGMPFDRDPLLGIIRLNHLSHSVQDPCGAGGRLGASRLEELIRRDP